MPPTAAAGQAGRAGSGGGVGRPDRAAADTGQVRVTKRRARTRARLLEAAFDVFAAEGFGHCTIEGVCDAAGFTRGAFYSNFTDLDELFFALYDDRSALIARQLTDALTTSDDEPDATLAELATRVTRVLLLDRGWLLVKTEFLLHAARRPEVARALADHREVLRAAVAQRLRELAEHGRALPPLLADADSAARAVIALYDGVTVQLLLDGDADAARAWLGRLVTAILSPAGPTAPYGSATTPEDSNHGR